MLKGAEVLFGERLCHGNYTLNIDIVYIVIVREDV
jgi:hypothetical protein